MKKKISDESNSIALSKIQQWKKDWCLFASDVFGVNLDEEQQAILQSVQVNKKTTVASGTSRGKDFVSAVAALCFLYLTPEWDENGAMIKNTKVALTAPTDRQIKNIMMPEISRLFRSAERNGCILPGNLNAYDIRTENEEWFLTGFKADEHNHEAWSGFHAVNTMFVITEASGIKDSTFAAIEGNLQGNSRILLVFNPNTNTGYAAESQKSIQWNKFSLNSLNATNVIEKKIVIPGQVDYEWVTERIKNWCAVINKDDFTEEEDDFIFEGLYYRPEDLFRVKILGKFPKVSEDQLIPSQWVELAQARWKDESFKQYRENEKKSNPLILGLDIAGMGRDSSVFYYRYGNFIEKRIKYNSGGKADHMKIAGEAYNILKGNTNSWASIDTIGEGAGVYSRLIELYGEKEAYNIIVSCKYSATAKDHLGKPLKDITEQYEFANMRAYLFWSIRDWLNPKNNNNPILPPSEELLQEATEIKWKFRSDGKIIIEPKEDIKERLKRSPDEFDALANTFYPRRNLQPQIKKYKYL